MLVMGVRPKVEGAELLPPKDEAVVFVANHGSYLDIPVTNFLPRVCKVIVLGGGRVVGGGGGGIGDEGGREGGGGVEEGAVGGGGEGED